MKWENYPLSESTWEPENNLYGCEELIEQLDIEMGHEIFGAKMVQNQVAYLLKYRDGFADREISHEEALAKLPKLLVDFLEKNVEMASHNNQTRNVMFSLAEADKTVGDPIRVKCELSFYFSHSLFFYYLICTKINLFQNLKLSSFSDATNLLGSMNYWFESKTNRRRTLHGAVMAPKPILKRQNKSMGSTPSATLSAQILTVPMMKC